tara:strand:- start:117 stop:635 length:519 start_codon:yes stop_codon:yes gene_type:complete
LNLLGTDARVSEAQGNHTSTETISFTCPFCQHTMNLPAEMEGKSGKCPKCQEAVIVLATPTTKASSTLLDSSGRLSEEKRQVRRDQLTAQEKLHREKRIEAIRLLGLFVLAFSLLALCFWSWVTLGSMGEDGTVGRVLRFIGWGITITPIFIWIAGLPSFFTIGNGWRQPPD